MGYEERNAWAYAGIATVAAGAYGAPLAASADGGPLAGTGYEALMIGSIVAAIAAAPPFWIAHALDAGFLPSAIVGGSARIAACRRGLPW